MNILIFTLVVIFIFEAKTQTCHDPNTTCKLLKECPSLRVLLKPTASPEDLKKLNDAQCSKETIDTGYRVCCPRPPCTTPHGIQGKCKDIHECPYLMDLLRSGTAENITYIQNSRCGENLEVCCIPNPFLLSVCLPTLLPVSADTGCCGVENIEAKISNSTEAGISEFPWLALIEYVHNNVRSVDCGGALISGRYVLTAAHCVIGEKTPERVRLGEYNTATSNPDCVNTNNSNGRKCNNKMIVIPILKIIAHIDYNTKLPKRHDIALLKLKTTAPYTDFVRPICLPSKDYSKVLKKADKLIVAGWGITENTVKSTVKLFADVPFNNKEDCYQAYIYRGEEPYNMMDGQLCAGGEDDIDPCGGDSGGPLMYQNGLTREIVGIISFGSNPCGSEAIPSVYTDVYHYLPWIYENMKRKKKPKNSSSLM